MAKYVNKFIEIDPETCPLEELKAAIDKMSDLSEYYEAKQLAIKLFINGTYGAIASKYFIGYNVDVAESITLQGQDLNHYSENSVNSYFKGIFQSEEEYSHIINVPILEYCQKYDLNKVTKFFKKDKEQGEIEVSLPISIDDILKENYSKEQKSELSKIYTKVPFGPYLGVKYDQIKDFKIGDGRVTKQEPLTAKEFPYLEGNDSLTIAGDTDSIYVEFGRIVNYVGITDLSKGSRFVVDLWNYGCGPYMEKKYDEYADKYNCDSNIQKLELEKIADTALMVAKKHYAMSECFKEPNIFINTGDKIIYAGLELIQRSTPPFARKCQADFTNYVLGWYKDNLTPPSFDVVLEKIKKYKADFIKQRPDDICKSMNISDYDKFVADDKNQLVLGLHIPIHVKAAAIANYFLNLDENKKYRVKYTKIKSRDKVKYYYTTNESYPVFGFVPEKYPLEYALPIDYNLQFEKTILEPVNRILKILGFTELSSDLCFTASLF